MWNWALRTGGNLIPMARYQPQASFLGIDLSANQIRKAIDDRPPGLTNVELRRGHPGAGRGWGASTTSSRTASTPGCRRQSREQLPGLSRALLKPASLLSHLSFNALPGWRMRAALRDILCFACRAAGDA